MTSGHDTGRVFATIEPDFELGLGHVQLSGELSGANAATAWSAILKCAAEHPQAVIVDLDGITIAQPRSLIVLNAVARRLSDDDIALLVVAHPATEIGSAARRTLAAEMPIYGTRAAALAATADAVPSPLRMHIYLPPLATSPAVARSLVQYACGSWRLDRLADRARLIMSEFVSNAVVHAATDLDITVVLRRDLLILQVRDRSMELPQRASLDPASATAEHGRGLRLVDSLATSWGSSVGPHGKTVWATIRVRPVSPSRGSSTIA